MMKLKLATLFVGITCLFLARALVAQSDALMGFSKEAAATQLEVEAEFDQQLNPDGERQELDAWFGLVVHLGNGQRSIDQLVQFLSTQYKGAPPGNLEQTIHSVVERLAESKFIVLTKEATELPYYLSLPYEQLDVEKARSLLAQDDAQFGKEISIE